MDIITLIQAVPGVGPYLPSVLVVFGICAVTAAQLPPPKSARSAYSVLYQLVNLLAHNYNQARNAFASTAKTTDATPPTAALVLLAALALPFGLGACSGAGSNSAADIAALESGLTAAETLATAYVQLPACEPAPDQAAGAASPLCSNSSVVAQIKTADAQAYTLVKAAESAAGDPSALSAAEAAVSALTIIVTALPKQGS